MQLKQSAVGDRGQLAEGGGSGGLVRRRAEGDIL